MRRDMTIIGRGLRLGLVGVFAVSTAAWGQSVPSPQQQAAEQEAVRQMQQDEADQLAEYDRMQAEQADADRAEAERADMRRLERDAQRRREAQREAQQEADMDAADELAREMDAAELERNNAETAAEWSRNEAGREASCRIMMADAIKAIHAQYDEKILDVQAQGGDHVAEHVTNLLQARDNVIAGLIDERCMAPHERRSRDERQRQIDRMRDGNNEMPPFQRNSDGSIGPAPRR